MYNLYLFLFIILTIIFEISAQYLFKLKYIKKIHLFIWYQLVLYYML